MAIRKIVALIVMLTAIAARSQTRLLCGLWHPARPSFAALDGAVARAVTGAFATAMLLAGMALRTMAVGGAAGLGPA